MSTEPNSKCVDAIYDAHAQDYSGLWIGAARGFYAAGNMLDAARAYENARNGDGKGKPGWNCLEAWRGFVEMRALQMAPTYKLELLQEMFYENLQVMPVLVPVPVGGHGAAAPAVQITYASVLECVRYYLLQQPAKKAELSALVVMLAPELADDENTFREGRNAELFLSIARDYAERDLGLKANVGYGYMRSGRYDDAVTVLEAVKRWLSKTGDLKPKVWISLANLYWIQASIKKSRNQIQDFMAMCKGLGSEAVAQQLEWALKVADEWGADEKFRELLGEMLAVSGPALRATESPPAGDHSYATGLLERVRKVQRPLSVKLRVLLLGFGYERRTDKIIAEVHGYLEVCGLASDFSVTEPRSLGSKVQIFLKEG